MMYLKSSVVPSLALVLGVNGLLSRTLIVVLSVHWPDGVGWVPAGSNFNLRFNYWGLRSLSNWLFPADWLESFLFINVRLESSCLRIRNLLLYNLRLADALACRHSAISRAASSWITWSLGLVIHQLQQLVIGLNRLSCCCALRKLLRMLIYGTLVWNKTRPQIFQTLLMR